MRQDGYPLHRRRLGIDGRRASQPRLELPALRRDPQRLPHLLWISARLPLGRDHDRQGHHHGDHLRRARLPPPADGDRGDGSLRRAASSVRHDPQMDRSERLGCRRHVLVSRRGGHWRLRRRDAALHDRAGAHRARGRREQRRVPPGGRLARGGDPDRRGRLLPPRGPHRAHPGHQRRRDERGRHLRPDRDPSGRSLPRRPRRRQGRPRPLGCLDHRRARPGLLFVQLR